MMRIQGDEWQLLTDNQIDPEEASYMSKFVIVLVRYFLYFSVLYTRALRSVPVQTNDFFYFSEKYWNFQEHALSCVFSLVGWVQCQRASGVSFAR